MSWSRFSECDVYTFPSTKGGVRGYECCGCWMTTGKSSFHTPDLDSFLVHLDTHLAAGDHVPPSVANDARVWAAHQ